MVKNNPKTVRGPVLKIAEYAGLRKAVEETLLRGQRKIDQARVETYWHTGRFIHEHLLFHKDRADYGNYTLLRLAGDLNVGKRLLERVLQFYREYPSIASTWTQLSWSHFRVLCGLKDRQRRLELTDQAAQEQWPVEALQVRIRNLNWEARLEDPVRQGSLRLPFVCLGPFYTWRIIRPETLHSRSHELLLDLGFSSSREWNTVTGANGKAGDIAQGARAGSGRWTISKLEKATEDSLYTFKAFVQKVIDGDTLRVEFDLGLGSRHVPETIRLRYLDCPERDTPEGKRAKAFVEAQLRGAEFITVKSVKTRREKWGRYLAEVFYEKEGSSVPVYLNQLLLDKGLAVRVRN